MARRPKLTSEEVEALMVPRLVDALYPVLIPMEQQCMEIQAKNRERVTRTATMAWRAFVEASSGEPSALRAAGLHEGEGK